MSIARRVLEQAMEKGAIRFKCASYMDARNLRQKCYNVRINDQKRSRRLFDPAEPGYGVSKYDDLILSVQGNILFISKLQEPVEITDAQGD